MDIKEMAIQCGMQVTENNYNALYEDDLPKFAQAVIAEFVKEQKPVGFAVPDYKEIMSKYGQTLISDHFTEGWKTVPLFTLEVKQND